MKVFIIAVIVLIFLSGFANSHAGHPEHDNSSADSTVKIFIDGKEANCSSLSDKDFESFGVSEVSHSSSVPENLSSDEQKEWYIEQGRTLLGCKNEEALEVDSVKFKLYILAPLLIILLIVLIIIGKKRKTK